MNELEFIKQLETKGITLTPQQVKKLLKKSPMYCAFTPSETAD